MREHGADIAINHRDADAPEQILAATGGRGVNVIIEMAANVNLDRDLTMLAKFGRIVLVGNKGRVEIDPRQAMGRDAAILGMTLFNVDEESRREIHAGLIAGLDNGSLNPVDQPVDATGRGRKRARRRDGAGCARQDRPDPMMTNPRIASAFAVAAFTLTLTGTLVVTSPRLAAQPRGKAVYDASLRRVSRPDRARRRTVRKLSGAAASRLQHRQVQDPHDRDRQRARPTTT